MRGAADGLQCAIPSYLAEFGEGSVTNGQIRQHLSQFGLKATRQYISTVLACMLEHGIVRRLSPGYWKINLASPRFRLACSRHLMKTPDRHGP